MSNEFLRPLSELPVPANLLGVLTDIDDTLTTEGEVPAHVVAAIARLKDAGLKVVPITGRPVGWSVPFASAWPVDAIVAENGAVALRRNSAVGLDKLYQQGDAERARNFARMQEVLSQIETTVPGANRATDSMGRECDIAVDHSEFTQMPQAQIDQCVQIMRDAGMNATVSSIHINGWFGGHNKLEGARWISSISKPKPSGPTTLPRCSKCWRKLKRRWKVPAAPPTLQAVNAISLWTTASSRRCPRRRSTSACRSCAMRA